MLCIRGYQATGAGTCSSGTARAYCFDSRGGSRAEFPHRASALGRGGDCTFQGPDGRVSDSDQHRRRWRSDGEPHTCPSARRQTDELASRITKRNQWIVKGRPLNGRPFSCSTQTSSTRVAGRSRLLLPFRSDGGDSADSVKTRSAASRCRIRLQQLSA